MRLMRLELGPRMHRVQGLVLVQHQRHQGQVTPPQRLLQLAQANQSLRSHLLLPPAQRQGLRNPQRKGLVPVQANQSPQKRGPQPLAWQS